jgi:hypothetical protein
MSSAALCTHTAHPFKFFWIKCHVTVNRPTSSSSPKEIGVVYSWGGVIHISVWKDLVSLAPLWEAINIISCNTTQHNTHRDFVFSLLKSSARINCLDWDIPRRRHHPFSNKTWYSYNIHFSEVIIRKKKKIPSGRDIYPGAYMFCL